MSKLFRNVKNWPWNVVPRFPQNKSIPVQWPWPWARVCQTSKHCHREKCKEQTSVGSLDISRPFRRGRPKNAARKTNRVFWTRDWIKCRRTSGVYHQLVKELELEDEAACTEYYRVNGQKFRFLVDSVGYATKKERYLGAWKHKAWWKNSSDFKISSHWGEIQVAWVQLSYKSYLYFLHCCRDLPNNIWYSRAKMTPSFQEEWESVAQRFESRWNFPKKELELWMGRKS